MAEQVSEMSDKSTNKTTGKARNGQTTAPGTPADHPANSATTPIQPSGTQPVHSQPPATGHSEPSYTFGDDLTNNNGGRIKIGVFGGTFDPIHIGHLILAEEAWFQLGLDRIYLVPSGDPPHKQDRRLTPLVNRIAMCELATRDIEYISISRIDADRPGPHYTSDMVRLVDKAAGENTQIFFLMGMDSLRDLPSWHEAAWLVENCRMVALSRHDVRLDWDALEAALPGIRERVIILDMPELEIASHTIQKRVRNGQPIRHQVPRAVEEYIYAHGLYHNGELSGEQTSEAEHNRKAE
jgi:nicotinate-nucleotide adenylyltransferase